MVGKRILVTALTGVLTLVGLATLAGPAEAAGVLTPSARSVAVGGSLTAQASGCANPPEGEGPISSFREPQVWLVTGTGASARAAAIASSEGDGRSTLHVPGWVDPAKPAVLRGSCVEYRFDGATPEGPATHTLFTYPDVTIDVTPATAPGAPAPVVALHRTTAAGGQVIVATLSGCAPNGYAQVALARGTDLALGGQPEWMTSADGETGADGSARVEVALLDDRSEDGGPLPEGGYVLIAACLSDPEADSLWFAEPRSVQVRGTNPSGSVAVEAGDDTGTLVVSGEGCTGGRRVTVTFRGFREEQAFGEVIRWAGRRTVNRLALGPDDGRFTDTAEAVPAGDGSWSITWTAPESGFSVQIQADCGDPAADGFRYAARQWYESGFSEQWIDRVSPTTSPTGDPVEVHVQGLCDDEATVRLTDDDGGVVAEGPLTGAADGHLTSGRLTAPSRAGRYRLAAACGGKAGYAQEYEVFAPTTLASPSALPAEPATGWPASGGRETYQGRIGPISLPAMADPEEPMPMEGDAVDRAGREMTEEPTTTEGRFETVGSSIGAPDPGQGRPLGPSELFIDVPRPTGDFAVTEMRFGLVDAAGRPVGAEDAHLHHFVIADRSSTNPACPGGTFGLPGEIVAAVGAERTPLEFGDPYGKVVHASDAWTGVYELMSRADRDQTLYLTYDMVIRRDVENVRPVRTYFGSATGCSSFTWTIDGSGTPDTQSHFVTIGRDGVLVGAGGHIHDGGLHSDLTDDRGRRLCRAELMVGDHPAGHSTHQRGRRDDSMTATTMVTGDPDLPVTDQGPPEYYDDDPVIESISRCALRERVVAGQRLRFDAVYANDRPRSRVMGIFVFHVWEGGGPAGPGSFSRRPASPARPYRGYARYTG